MHKDNSEQSNTVSPFLALEAVLLDYGVHALVRKLRGKSYDGSRACQGRLVHGKQKILEVCLTTVCSSLFAVFFNCITLRRWVEIRALQEMPWSGWYHFLAQHMPMKIWIMAIDAGH